MKALVIGRNSQLSQSPGAPWGALSPLADRPFLHHVVETIVGQGIREITFIIPEQDHIIANMLGSGVRWGARFEYYSAKGAASIYDRMRDVQGQNPEEDVLLAHSDRLPHFHVDTLSASNTLLCWRANNVHWTGWGVIRWADLTAIPTGLEEPGLLTHLLKSAGEVGCYLGQRPLTARTYEELLDSNLRILSGEFPDLLFSGKEVRPGIWMARNVKVHPTAKVAAPAFLGENCRIGAFVEVGPSASIGRDCLIERETHVADSVVCSGSYVGEHLDLKNVVVDHSRLFNATCDAEIDGVDELLLGSVFGNSFRSRFRRACSRIAASAALILFLPVFAALFLGVLIGIVQARRKRLIVLTPSVTECYRWKTFELWSFGNAEFPNGRRGWAKHFFCDFLPALLAVADGYMSLAGPRPRTESEVESLIPSRRSAYLRYRCGILQPILSGDLDDDPSAFDEAGTGLRKSIRLLKSYAARVFFSCLPGFGSGQEPSAE